MTKQIQYMPMTSANSTSLNGTYQLLFTVSEPAVIVKCINDSNVNVTLSIDGVTAHDFVPAFGFFLYDIRTNHGREQQLAFKIGTQFYVNGAAGAGNAGSIYFVALNEGQ